MEDMAFQRILAGLVVFAPVWQAQSPADLFTKAPPAVDSALRERVGKFYQAHVDGKFRVADQYVAEDSKDIFFEADKRRCTAFEIARINYSDEFRKAQVVVTCDTEMMIMPVGVQQVKVPISSTWRLENGEWLWYVVPTKEKDTPFGRMKPGPPVTGVQPPVPGAMPQGPSPAELARMVEVDRQEVRFNLTKPGEEVVTITSRLPGTANIEVEKPNFPGLTAHAEPAEVATGQASRIIVSYRPPDAKVAFGRYAVDLRVRVQPVGRVIPIRVIWAN